MEPKPYKAKTCEPERVAKVKRFLEMALAARKREKAAKEKEREAEDES